MITRIGTYSQIKGSSFKLPCIVATLENISLSGEQTIDGIPVISGERVLVRSQANEEENGTYVVSLSGWTRSVDMSLNDDVYQGLLVYIITGTTNGDETFVLSTPDPIILDVTPLIFDPTGCCGIDDIAFDFNDVDPLTCCERPYYLDVKASFPYTILSAVLQSDDDLDGVTISINNVPITGLDGVAVGTGLTDVSATNLNLVGINDSVTLTIDCTGTNPTLIRGKLRILR